MKPIYIFTFFIYICLYPLTAMGLDIIPGAKGFGMDTRAAYTPANDPIICIVTTLADGSTRLNDASRNGIPVKTGSFRGCVEYDPPSNTGKIILFEVSGEIDITINGNIKLRNPYNIIAGATAPSPGIMIRGAALLIGSSTNASNSAHDTLLQHIRFRTGDDPQGPDGESRDSMNVFSPRVVVDHCSFSWGIDENTAIANYGSEGVNEITFRYCIISEALRNPKLYDPSLANHGGGEPLHSAGLLITGTTGKRIALIGNIFAHNRHRNPFINAPVGLAYVNNVIYNWEDSAFGLWKDKANGAILSIVGNKWIRGINTSSGDKEIAINVGAARIYVADNLGPTKKNTEWSLVNIYDDYGGGGTQISSPEVWPEGLVAVPASEVLDYVSANAGAFPKERDSADLRVIMDIRDKTGRGLNSQYEVGGWPEMDPKSHTLVLPDDPHGDADGDGYTNLEEWLHNYASIAERTISNPKDLVIKP